jgi:hypothetical protein
MRSSMQINQAAIQRLHEEVEKMAGGGKIIPFPQKHEPNPEVVKYFEALADVRVPGLREKIPSAIPVDPALREQHLQNVEEARRRRLEREFGPMVIPVQFQGLSPWVLVEQYGDGIKKGKVNAIKAAAAWAGVDLSTRRRIEPTTQRPGLLLYGDPGTGKSALAWWAVQARGWGLWLTWNDLLGKIQNEWEGREALIEAAQNAPVLFLDDLGDPYSTNSRITDDRRTILFRIVNHRLANQLPTIITSNVNGGNLDIVMTNLERQFDERIVDRLFELCHFVEMAGANLRRAPKKVATQ